MKNDLIQEEVVLDVKNLTKIYTSGLIRTTKVVGIQDITFKVKNSEIVSLVGESGSGKSTTANIILRLLKPTSGIVFLNGKPIEEFKKKEYYRKVQVVFQDPYGSYNLYHKVDRILNKAFQLTKDPPPLEERERITLDVLNQMGIRADELLGRYPHQLSGGQLQRLMLARVLIIRPELLIADEATSMIDASSRAGVLNLIQLLAKDEGLAVIYITHDIGQAQYISDNVIVMQNGLIVEQGDPSEVFLKPKQEYTKELICCVPTMHQRWEFIEY
ncbi:MAG: ABC transporter ATP-binding protein [Candidatus Thorarchaeota archaeon]